GRVRVCAGVRRLHQSASAWWIKTADPERAARRSGQVRQPLAARRRYRGRDGGHLDGGAWCHARPCIWEKGQAMKTRTPSGLLLQIYTGIVFAFIFVPLVTIAVFSFNADRFPSLPWAGFSLT